MKSVIIIGAGHIGTVIAEELSGTGNYHITLADNDTGRLARLHLPDVDLMQLDVQDVKALHAALLWQCQFQHSVFVLGLGIGIIYLAWQRKAPKG